MEAPLPVAREAGAHILVVEDDGETRRLLARLLREHGYEASVARDGDEMWEMLGRSQPDLVLLDIMLPGRIGFDLCRSMRERGIGTPIIMVTAKGDQASRVIGLDVGADDYLGKPFSQQELLARIRAVLRRAGTSAEGIEAAQTRRGWSFAGWRLDATTRVLLSPTGMQVDLSSAEFDLLVVFITFSGRPLSRERLLELSRQRSSVNPSADRSIDMLVSRLRRKLASHDDPFPIIRTSRGVGYVFTAHVTTW